jgi:fructose 1,6-bisphosphate aldolase/phosphatase
LPAVGEALTPFAFPHIVSGALRGSHRLPLMPVSLKNARCTVFDSPPRCVALGFQLRNCELIGLNGKEPADLFDDPAFDRARSMTNRITEYLRRHGEFEPARLGMDELEYTGIVKILEKLKERWKQV